MSVTAKSVVFDIADCWGHASRSATRGIDFLFDGTSLGLTAADYTAYATSSYAGFNPSPPFDTAVSQTGSGDATTSWASADGGHVNQRLIIIFDTPHVFDEIQNNNYHHSGTTTNAGLKNVKITTSTDAITDTTYNAAISNATVLNNTVWPEHEAADTADWQVVWFGEVSTVSHLVAMDFPYGDAVEAILAATDMPYHILYPHQAHTDMVYSLKLAAAMVMYYDDAPGLMQTMAMHYGDAPALMQISEQRYGELLMHCKATDMEYHILKPMLQTLEARYGINGESLMAISEQQYELSEYNPLRKITDMPYLLQSDLLIRQVATSLTINGVDVAFSHLAIDGSRDSFIIEGEAHLARLSEFQAIKKGDLVEATCNETTFIGVVARTPRRSRPGGAATTYIVEFASPAIRLQSPWTKLLNQEFSPTLAQTVIDDLLGTADLGPCDYQTVSFPVLADTLYANDEDAYTVIRKLTQSVGAKIQSNPDGTVRIEAEYPEGWHTTAPIDYYMTDERNFISQDESPDPRSGENKYLVSNSSAADERIWTEQKEVSDSEVMVYGFQVPWEKQPVHGLTHSGGEPVPDAEYMGVVEALYPPEDEPAERVEFKAGFADAARPIYGQLAIEWVREQLGAITYSEDGKLEAELKDGPTEGYSLCDIRYLTKYHMWTVRNEAAEGVQYLLWVETDD